MDDPNEEARKLAADFWEDILQLEPMIGTMVGDERFDDKLSDPGPEGRARSEEVHRRALDAIQRFDRKELDEEGRTILAVIEAIARRQLARLGHRIDRFDAVTHLFGPSQLLADFGSMQRADTPERLERYRTRLGLLPAFLDEAGEVARDAAFQESVGVRETWSAPSDGERSAGTDGAPPGGGEPPPVVKRNDALNALLAPALDALIRQK